MGQDIARFAVMKARYAWENYQRAILAFSCILLTFVAFVCLIVAGATPGWTRIINKDPKNVAEDGVVASFGLFRGSYKIDSGFSDIARGDEFDVGKYIVILLVYYLWLFYDDV